MRNLVKWNRTPSRLRNLSFIGRKRKAENNTKSLLEISDIDLSTTADKNV